MLEFEQKIKVQLKKNKFLKNGIIKFEKKALKIFN